MKKDEHQKSIEITRLPDAVEQELPVLSYTDGLTEQEVQDIKKTT